MTAMTEKDKNAELTEHLLNQGLRPQAPQLAGIGFSGGIAVVVFEAGEGAREMARAIGWDGASPIFRLSEDGQKALASTPIGQEPRTTAWLHRKFEPAQPVAKVLVVTGDRFLLVNFSLAQGWYVEPGPAKPAMVN